MKDLFKVAQKDCNCPGPGYGGYKCKYCRLKREDKIRIKRRARRILKMEIKNDD